jgi:3-hydroxybutyryl-CoA dehydratase
MDVQPLPEIGHWVEFTRSLDDAAVTQFADLIDDHNPLYTDEQFAARSVYGQRLVQGALLVGLVNSALTRLTGPGFVLMGQEVRFSAAVHIGEQLRVTAEVIRVREDKRIVSAETHVYRQDGESAFRGVGGLMQLELTS